jgi:hypothetical protein
LHFAHGRHATVCDFLARQMKRSQAADEAQEVEET